MKTQLKVSTMYNEIKNLFRDGLSKSAISRQTGHDRKTVQKYLSMSLEELECWKEHLRQRARKLAPYEEFTRDRIERFPQCTAAQVEDWIKERYADPIPATSRTIFNFTEWVRLKHDLPKPKSMPRQCQAVEELPYGQQAQVDFGEQYMYDTDKKRVKVYFMIMVLSRSRRKHIWFTDQPVTTRFVIEAHEMAFAFFEGIVKVIVYDQDSTILADENCGNLIFTDEFDRYVLQMGFEVFMCHKADPQTKGKVENGVKFVKGNFLEGRTFINLATLNEDGIKWLNRTGNAKMHETTCLVPESEWLVEKTYLREFTPLPLAPNPGNLYRVRTDNTVRYRSNRYTLPLGTYQGPDTQVQLRKEGSTLLIHSMDGQLLASHEVAIVKGKLVANSNHRRDTSAKIDALQADLQALFPDAGRSGIFLNEIRKGFPRYARDQFAHLRKTITDQPADLIGRTLAYCLDHHLFSCGEFQGVFIKLLKEGNPKEPASLKEYRPMTPQGDLDHILSVVPITSNINEYQQIMS